MLDGILGNRTDLPVAEHATDTHGATLANFALFDLLGLAFAPHPRPGEDHPLPARPALRLHLALPVRWAPGPWYLTWLTSFVVMAVLFVYGMRYGLVYWRWNLAGLLVFGRAQVTVEAAAALSAANTDAWAAIGRFFTSTLGAAGLTSVLAALAVVLLAGGSASMRRVTV